MKNTPFKMNGFSGFGNSPLKQAGHLVRLPYYEKGYTEKKKKKKRGSGWWRRTGRKTLKFFDKILPGGNYKPSINPNKIGCGPRGC